MGGSSQWGGGKWLGAGLEIFFVFLKNKKKQICHLMDPKTNKKENVKQKSKNPSPKIFFFLDTNCFVSCHVLISILTQCVV